MKPILFFSLEDGWNTSTDIVNDTDAFTRLMYGYGRITDINEVRHLMIKKMGGEDATLTTRSKVGHHAVTIFYLIFGE